MIPIPVDGSENTEILLRYAKVFFYVVKTLRCRLLPASEKLHYSGHTEFIELTIIESEVDRLIGDWSQLPDHS